LEVNPCRERVLLKLSENFWAQNLIFKVIGRVLKNSKNFASESLIESFHAIMPFQKHYDDSEPAMTITTKRTYRFTFDSIAAIQHLQMVIRCKFPGDHYYDDVLAFDPFADEPLPETEEKIRNMMGDTADGCLEPDVAWAIRKTGLLVSTSGLHMLDEQQLAAWTEAIEEYARMTKRTQ
jgi:hypothetical protein